MKKIVLGVMVVSMIAAGTAKADTLVYSASIPLSLTDWSDVVSIPRFDPALGTLNSIQFMVMAHIEGATFYENQETAPTDVSLTLSAELSLMRPDTSAILTATPSTTVNETAGAFDGVLDFDGPSGSTFSNLFADVMQSATSPLPLSDLALFTGVLPIDLPISASGNSFGSGPGNWIFGFSLSASADVEVTYEYTPIPEPGSAVLGSLGGLLVFRRRRASGVKA